MTQATFYIGIDGVGTKCRVRIEDADGKHLSAATSGSANIMRDMPLAQSSIMHAIEHAVANAPVPILLEQCVVGAGLAGANVPSAAQLFKQWNHPFHSIYVLSDLHAACIGAHGGENGAAIIIGTGSTGASFIDGKFEDVGGHGFPIGDIGSGAWLGLQAIQHTLLSLDGLQASDALSRATADHFNAKTPLDLVQTCAGFVPCDYASVVPKIAPLLGDKDPAASHLFDQAAAYIQKMADKLIGDNDLPLCLIGGLSHIIAERLSPKTQHRLRNGVASPEKGALTFAKQSLNLQEIIV